MAPNTDNQTLSFTGTNLSVSGGNSVALASLQDNMGNHSASQDVVLNGNMISNDGGSEGVTLDDNGELLVSAAFQRPARFRNSLNGHASYIEMNNTAGGADRVINEVEHAAGVAFGGTTEPGSTVQVTLGGVSRAATVGADGNWTVNFAAPLAPRPG